MIRGLRREVQREGTARHIHATRAVHREALRRADLKVTRPGRSPYGIGAAPAKIAGIAEHGIDDQRPGMIVAAKAEADLVPGYGEPPFDAGLPVSVHLVQLRLLERGRAVGSIQDRIALRVDAGARAIDPPGDAAGVGAGGDDKVVLQLALIAVEDQIHAGVDLGILDLAIRRNARAPVLRIVTDEVTHYAGLRGQPYRAGLGICPDQAHAEGVDGRGLGWLSGRRGRWRLLPLEVQDGLARSEEERVAGTAREELNRGGRLPLVGLEAQWHAHALLFGAESGRWERARVLRRKGGGAGTGLWGGLWRRRGGARPAKTEGDRNYRQRRYCPKRARLRCHRRPFACHTVVLLRRWEVHWPGLPMRLPGQYQA